MRILVTLASALILAIAGCSSDDNSDDAGKAAPAETSQSSPAGERGGTITVGEESWTIVPSIQCSIYPGNVVSIAGHAAGDPSLEIVIDYGGPSGVRIGDGGSEVSWNAIRDTIKIEIDGTHVTGTATFSTGAGGSGESAPGSFDVNCS
jgi:hypothetical protein